MITELLEKAVATARNLAPDLQDEIARLVLAYAGEDEAEYVFSDEEAAELDEAEGAATRGDFLTDDEVAALWANRGPETADHAPCRQTAQCHFRLLTLAYVDRSRQPVG